MAELTRQDQQAIAELAHHPGYRRLLDLLGEQERHILEDAEYEPDAPKLLRTMRFWQFVVKINRILASAPETIAAELKRLQEDGQFDPDAPYSRDYAWQTRFSRPVQPRETFDEQDELDDPASI